MLGFEFLIDLGLGNAKALLDHHAAVERARADVDRALFKVRPSWNDPDYTVVEVRGIDDLRAANYKRASVEESLFEVQARCCRALGLYAQAHELERTAATWVRDEGAL